MMAQGSDQNRLNARELWFWYLWARPSPCRLGSCDRRVRKSSDKEKFQRSGWRRCR